MQYKVYKKNITNEQKTFLQEGVTLTRKKEQLQQRMQPLKRQLIRLSLLGLIGAIFQVGLYSTDTRRLIISEGLLLLALLLFTYVRILQAQKKERELRTITLAIREKIKQATSYRTGYVVTKDVDKYYTVKTQKQEGVREGCQ